MQFDKMHSVFWKAKTFELFTLKLKDKDAFALSIIEKERRALALLSGDEFSSFICEILKYCLDLPEIARAVPCPIDLTKVFHGCLQTMQTKLTERNGKIYLDIGKFDERFLKYHGYPEEWEIEETKNKEFPIVVKPLETKALQERIVTELQIIGKDNAIRIQTEQNPALRIYMTIKKHMLDKIDEAVKLGLYLNRQELIVSALRNEVKRLVKGDAIKNE